MPTVCEIKAELKELGVKGITGKKKAELMAILEHAKAPKSIPVPRKKKKKPMIEVEAPKAEAKKEAKKANVATLAQYLKPYKGAYQDYEDSDGREVVYPTADIKQLITLAYNGASFNEIVKATGYDADEVKTMLYDHFTGRTDIDNPKENNKI